MPMVACPTCSTTYNLRDEFVGRMLKCNGCGKSFAAVVSAAMAPQPQALPMLEHDQFFMRQKMLAINERYAINDRNKQPLIHVIRRTFLTMGLLAALAGLVTLLVVGGGLIAPAVAMAENPNKPSTLLIAWFIFAGVLALVACIFVAVSIYPKRHVEFYRDAEYTQRLFDILQDGKWQIINATYTMRDANGEVLVRFHKNYLYNFFRKRWNVLSPDQATIICRAFEDSILLSILRRFLGTFYGLLRTNFIITAADSDRVIGEFNRKFTLFDSYVLDLTADPHRELDRRVAVALAVLLDTGERR